MPRVWILVVIGATILLSGSVGGAAADTDVTAHGSHDTFVVNGSARDARGTAESGCQGCAQVIWIPACLTTSPTLVLSAPGRTCPTVGDETCSADRRFLREWTAGPDGWVPGDARCRSVSGGVSLAVIESIARQSVVHRVPTLSLTRQPRGRPIVVIPVLFDSGQPDGELVWRDSVVGVSVTTRVAATWQWDFGDGSMLRTADAGGAWPDRSVSHTYSMPGRYTTTVAAHWTGSFEVAGLGEMPISGAVTQRASEPLTITTAGARFRAVLP